MSATRNNEKDGTSDTGKGSPNSVLRFLSSLKLTIGLLTFIAVASILGTVIRQGADVDEYLSIYSYTTYKFIRLLGLDDVYHARWFYLALVLFALNLTLCTVQRLKRFLGARKELTIPDEPGLSVMAFSFRVDERGVGDVMKALPGGYRRTYEGPEGAILEKGSFSRYGVYFIHLSVLLILVGALVGSLFGFKGFITMVKGETKGAAVIRGASAREEPLGFAVRLKEFNVSFYPSGQPKDYVSQVEVIEGGHKAFEKQIRVNDPLSYRGIRIYQATYGTSASFLFNIDGEPVMLGERAVHKKGGLTMMVVRHEGKVHDFGPGVLVAYLDGGEPKPVWFLRDVARFNEKQLGSSTVRLQEIKEEFYTGLEVSRDPGVWVVWTGFALMLLGLHVTFFTYHRKIYVRKTAGGIMVAGMAQRNRESFKEEFERLKGRLTDG
jgi:cytochrome c biogenesis protein